MPDLVGLATVFSSILAVFGYFQWRLAKHQLKVDLMTRVHERYSALYPLLSDLPAEPGTYDCLTRRERETISAYLNLCSEQFHWRVSEKIIDDAIWKVWDVAIAEKLQSPAIRLAWTANHRNDVFYTGFSEYVERHLQMPTVAVSRS